jgi:hypothetical protein
MKLLFSNAAIVLAVSSLYLSAFAPVKTVNGHAAMTEPMSRYVLHVAVTTLYD